MANRSTSAATSRSNGTRNTAPAAKKLKQTQRPNAPNSTGCSWRQDHARAANRMAAERKVRTELLATSHKSYPRNLPHGATSAFAIGAIANPRMGAKGRGEGTQVTHNGGSRRHASRKAPCALDKPSDEDSWPASPGPRYCQACA